MKKDFIIHIGPHKTGTTYLQKTFFDNKEKLLENGILYPAEGLQVHWGQHMIAEHLRIKNYSIVEDYISKIKNSDEDILISSENFDRLKIDDIFFLKSLLDEYNVKIIFVKRSLGALLVSNWQESIKYGEQHSWKSYCLEHITKAFASGVINTNKILDNYSEIFGFDCISIINYDTLINEKIDICDAFFDLLNKPMLQGIGSKEYINKSISAIDIEILRSLNILYSKHKKDPQDSIREAYIMFIESNQNNTKYIQLKKIINEFITSVNFNDILVFNIMNTSFKNKYSNNVIGELSKQEVIYKESFELPDENWIFRKDALNLVNSLYSCVLKYVEIQA
jgi:hypothetical protein